MIKADRKDERMRVMQTCRPFMVFELLSWNTTNTKAIDSTITRLNEGDLVGRKIPGYTIFVVCRGNLMNHEVDQAKVEYTCERIGEWFKEHYISYKPSKYSRAKED